MNKKPVLLRSFFSIVVIAIFVAAIFPLTEKNFYDTFESILDNPDAPEIQKVIAEAKELKAKDETMYDSAALETAANENNVNLAQYVKPVIAKRKRIITNGDVMSLTKTMASGSIRLGIDLNGGVEFMLKLIPTEEGMKTSDFNSRRDAAIEILRKRLEGKSIYESEVTPAGKDYISLRAPLNTNAEKENLEKLISMTAQLQFRLVAEDSHAEVAKYLADPEGYTPPEGTVIMKETKIAEDGSLTHEYLLVNRKVEMDGKQVANAFVSFDPMGQRKIILQLKPKGAVQFGEITRNNLKRRLAVVLDGQLYSAPTIQTEISGGQAEITGTFSREEAENLVNALVGGSVPFIVRIEQKSDIDPSVGEQTIKDSLMSGLIGTILVMLFMLIYYRKAGMVANISLIVNAALILGALAAFNVTLTLPGIAGIVLTIGMAVDANVLIYERIREELAQGKTIINAVDAGFSRAFSAIFDSNLTTLFTALILLWQGTGAIKGFAMTLAIGIFTTMFTAVFLTKVIFDVVFRIPWLSFKSLKMMSFFTESHINFHGQRKIALGLSGLMILISFGFVAYKGKEVLGIDFTGGTQLEMSFAKEEPVEEISKFLDQQGYDAKVTYKTSNTSDGSKSLEVVLRAQSNNDNSPAAQVDGTITTAAIDKIMNELEQQFPEAKFTLEKQDVLGALVGESFAKSAILAIVLAMVAMIVYMMIRFEFAYSIAANVAIVHDVIISVGIYLLCGGQITLQVVAGILTLIGYSVNDTIVTFDRQRENLQLYQGQGRTYWDIVNLSVNQTLGRTILTAVSVIIILLTQLLLGGSGIRDFVAVMLIGCIVGTYSSIYVATIIVAYWHKPVANVKERIVEKPADNKITA